MKGYIAQPTLLAQALRGGRAAGHRRAREPLDPRRYALGRVSVLLRWLTPRRSGRLLPRPEPAGGAPVPGSRHPARSGRAGWSAAGRQAPLSALEGVPPAVCGRVGSWRTSTAGSSAVERAVLLPAHPFRHGPWAPVTYGYALPVRYQPKEPVWQRIRLLGCRGLWC